jgi:hypothetical protein
MKQLRIISETEAEEVLAPCAAELREAIEDAFKYYCDAVMPVLGPVPSYARATVLHELIIKQIRKRWPDQVIEAASRVLLRLQRDVLVQFKLLNPNRLPSNYPTKQARDFACQLSLTGIPDAVRLTLGYRINGLGTALADICVMCSTSLTSAEWYYDLMDAKAPIKQLQLPAAPAKQRKLRPKTLPGQRRGKAQNEE